MEIRSTQQLADYLHEAQEHHLIHFEYADDTFYAIFGPNRTEGFIGKGKTLGEAIYDLIQAIAHDITETSNDNELL